jgi:dolichyl-phosphate-mannose--protein O-mannosyl transferase
MTTVFDNNSEIIDDNFYKVLGLYIPKFEALKWSLVFLILAGSLFFRFLNINDPEHIHNADDLTKNVGLVFDESYFVPQTESYAVHKYFFDIHPPASKFWMYQGMTLFNSSEKLAQIDPTLPANKVDNYNSVLDLNGIRFFPRIFGALIPVIIFFTLFKIINSIKPRRINNLIVPTVIAIMAMIENAWIVDAKYALTTQFLLFFVALNIMSLVYFYFSQTKLSRWFWFVTSMIVFGNVLSTKWFGLALLPVIFLIYALKEYSNISAKKVSIEAKLNSLKDNQEEYLQKMKMFQELFGSKVKMFFDALVSAIPQIFLTLLVAIIIYFGYFAWHFAQFQHVSNDANNNKELGEFCAVCLSDLEKGENNAWLWQKVWAQTQIAKKYNENVVALDLSKSDEIGSAWYMWPFMSRVIPYLTSWYPDGRVSYVILMGNVANWYMIIAGFVLALGIVFVRVFTGNIKGISNIVLFFLGTLVLGYFLNWLPFANLVPWLVNMSRVFYLYHYMPAMFFMFLAFGIVIEFVVFPRIDQLASNYKNGRTGEYNIRDILGMNDFWKTIVVILILLASFISFVFYLPFTYNTPLTSDQFRSLNLRPEWDLKWKASNN